LNRKTAIVATADFNAKPAGTPFRKFLRCMLKISQHSFDKLDSIKFFLFVDTIITEEERLKFD